MSKQKMVGERKKLRKRKRDTGKGSQETEEGGKKKEVYRKIRSSSQGVPQIFEILRLNTGGNKWGGGGKKDSMGTFQKEN